MDVTLYENQLSSKVTAGENSGHTLKQDFVVRRWLGPLDVDAQRIARLQETISLPRDGKPPAMGLVVFVQNPNSEDVLQALVLPLGRSIQDRSRSSQRRYDTTSTVGLCTCTST